MDGLELSIYFSFMICSRNTTFFFFTKTSNFGVETEHSYFFFLRFEPENVLDMFFKVQTKFDYKLSCSSVYHAIGKLRCLC